MRTTKSISRTQDVFKKILAVTTTGAIAAVPFLGTMTASQADPPSHAPAHGYRNKHHGRDTSSDRRHRRDDRKDYRYDDDRWDKRHDDRWDNRYDDRRYDDRWDKRRDDRWDDRRGNDYRSYTGTVTRVRGRREFDLRVGGRTYNVTSNNSLPRNFDRGDIVRVYGVRSGDNNINNARVVIVNNR